MRPGSYTKILLNPVTVWRGSESKTHGVSQADTQRLAGFMFALAYNRFSEDYEMVKAPAPGTIRISVSLTKLGESKVALDVISNVVPVGRVLSRGREIATGKPSFVGEASIETKIKDAQTRTRQPAAIPDTLGCACRHIRLHRVLLQPENAQ